MEIYIEGNSVYCPCCGRIVFSKLNGMAEHRCTRCHVKLTCIVKGAEYTVMTATTRANIEPET